MNGAGETDEVEIDHFNNAEGAARDVFARQRINCAEIGPSCFVVDGNYLIAEAIF
jgi:hypothetical protein